MKFNSKNKASTAHLNQLNLTVPQQAEKKINSDSLMSNIVNSQVLDLGTKNNLLSQLRDKEEQKEP